MNVLFHVTAASGIIAALSHVSLKRKQTVTLLSGFTLGVLSHGILDYSPHCYPIHSKLDFILSSLIMLIIIWKVNKSRKLMVCAVFLGGVFPDIIDLSPAIANTQLNIHLPTFKPVFPWHYPDYSGSIYTGSCQVSTVNHFLTLLFTFILLYLNRKSVINLFRYK